MDRNVKIAIILAAIVLLMCILMTVCGLSSYVLFRTTATAEQPLVNDPPDEVIDEIIDQDVIDDKNLTGQDQYFPGMSSDELTPAEARLKAKAYLENMGDNYVSVGNKNATTKFIYIGTTMQIDNRLIIPELERLLDLTDIEIRYVHTPCPYCNPGIKREDVYSDMALHCANKLNVYLPFRKELLKDNTPDAYTDYPAVIRDITGSQAKVDAFNQCYNGTEAFAHVQMLGKEVKKWHSYTSDPTVVLIDDGEWYGASYGIGTYELLGVLQAVDKDVESFRSNEERDTYKRAVLLLTLYEIKKKVPYGSQLPTTLESGNIRSEILGDKIIYTPSKTGFKLGIKVSDGTVYEMEEKGNYRFVMYEQ